MSRKPCVVSSAQRAPLRSRMVLIATVVPCRNSRAASNAEPALPTPVLDAGDEPLRRGQRLAELELAGRLVERRDVGERAADVGGQADRRGLTYAGIHERQLQRSFHHVVSRVHQRLGRQVGDEAVRRRVRDEQRQPRVLGGALRGHAAGPEHRHDAVGRRRHRRRRTAAPRDRRRSPPDRRCGSARRG